VVRCGQLLMLERNQPLTLVFNVVIAAVYGLAVWHGGYGLGVFWWVGAIYLVTAIRMGIYLRSRRTGGAQERPAWALRSFVGGLLAADLVWGIVAMMLTETADTFVVGSSSFFVTAKLLEASFCGVMCPPDKLQAAASSRIMSDAFSPIIMQAALVLPETTVGMIEASATRKPDRPCTRNR